VKDVSLKGYSDELLLNEVDEMTNIAYEKESSYLEGKDDGIKQGIEQNKREMAKSLKEQGFPISAIEKASGLSEEEIRSL
jgi:predicted transposase/invertase (TIGR01784 family)